MPPRKNIQIKRVYEEASPTDGYRVLIDRLWPRGISKDTAALDEWNKTLSPSADLRKWFNHEDELFKEFDKRYRSELAEHSDELERLRKIAAKGMLTLVYAAKKTDINNAVVLREVLLKK